GFLPGGVAQCFHLHGEIRKPRPTRLAGADVSQQLPIVVGGGRLRGQCERRETIERHAGTAYGHFSSPNNVRSFRIARNKCTRTVAGLIPVASLISAAVRSSMCDSVKTN